MSTVDKLIEEVYANTGFRGEFAAYARLKALLDADALRISATVLLPAAQHRPGFLRYHQIDRETPKPLTDSPQIATCKRGMALLFSALFRSLSLKYDLDAQETRSLVLGVAARYS